METASRQSKASNIVDSLKFLHQAVNQLQTLNRELRGVTPAIECDKPVPKEPIPSIATIMAETPSELRCIGEDIHKAVSELREILI